MSKNSTPPSSVSTIPDYTSLNQNDAQQGTQLARFNQVTPFGSSTWTNDGNKYTQTNTLDPTQQGILDQQNEYSMAVGNALNNSVSGFNLNPINANGLPAAPINAGQTAQDAIMSRLNPQMERQRGMLDTQMANQGIASGTEAWKNAHADQDYRENDLRTQAALQGINAGQSARSSELQNQIAIQNQPINAANALRGGMMAQVPQFQNSTGSVAPNSSGAAAQGYNANMGLYNAATGQQNNMMSGLFGLGAAGISAYPW